MKSNSPRFPLGSLYKKELGVMFDSPMAYVIGIFFLGFTSVWFFVVQEFFALDVASFRPYFGLFPLVFLILLPALTMRSWAEEKRQGTVELLFTLPFREWDLVLAKYFATMTMFCLLLVGTLPVIFLVLPFGSFDPGPIASQYLGTFFLGAAGIALGQYLSSLTSNQVTAFLCSAGVLLVFTLMDRLVISLGSGGTISTVLLNMSFTYRYNGFVRGLVDTRDLVFFLLLAWGFLFLNTRSLVHQKWR